MSQIEQPPLDGELVHHPDFPSQYVRPRPVDVSLDQGAAADHTLSVDPLA